jgi:hypothetical protein
MKVTSRLLTNWIITYLKRKGVGTMKMARTILIAVLLFPAAAAAQDSKKVWKEIVKPCTLSELQGKRVIFLGLSNNVEVGTLLRPRPDQGGYGRASFRNVIDEYAVNPGSSKPMPDPISGGNFIRCEGAVSKKKNLNASVGLLSAVLPFTGNFGLALSKATITSGTVEKVAMYDMDELVMARIIDSLPANGQVRSALTLQTPDKKPVWYMVSRAFRIQDLKVKIDFKKNVGADFKAKYNGPLSGTDVGELGVGLTASWVTDSVLELTTTTPLYIAAELASYRPSGGFEAGKKRFSPVVLFSPKKVTETELR